ncbi:uncharacterized protein cd34 [Trichomycterus rosablanca]|uniref:uncharacterized protein cd34 n=1 Tax=Trichomycterus rosablanca TaxID=2290929 RepID=UPI002F353C6E
MQRMNEMWRKMPLMPILCVLLLLTCQSNCQNTTSTSVEPSSAATEQTTQQQQHHSTVGNIVNSQTLTGTVIIVNPESTASPVTGNPGTTQSVASENTTNIMGSGDPAKPATKQPTADIARAAPNSQDTEKSQPTTGSISDNRNMVEKSHNDHLNAVSTVASGTDKPGNVRKSYSEESSQGASVFWGLLVTGLLLAAALIGGHVWKNHRCSKGKGMALAEESCVADEENQGNTLVSVAPLNPPESQEKPSQNGESLESVKLQNPPNTINGHSATKADTEL